MARDLIDLLWRDHGAAPAAGSRGPRSRHSTGDLVAAAIGLARAESLAAVTIRAVAQRLDIAPMSVYTHVAGRDDLLVLMADEVAGERVGPAFGTDPWPTRVRRVAEDNLNRLLADPWLLGIDDGRLALGPSTIARYDHELHALDGAGFDDITRDAALTFVLQFVRTSAAALAPSRGGGDHFPAFWAESADRLADYVGDRHPLARRVGGAAGAAMDAPTHAGLAWQFGLDRVIDGLRAAAGAPAS